MNFAEYAKEYIPKINNAIKIVYDSKINSMDNNFLKDYYIELRDYFLTGGKRIRPLLCIAAYNAFNSMKDGKIIQPSIGTEFLHNASLIHDDIIDKDDFRRGKPAFHYRFKQYHQRYDLKKMVSEDFGTSIGIIGGDTSYFLGLEAFLSNDFNQDLNFKAIRYYEEAFNQLCQGVLIEVDMVNQKELSMEDYIKMIALKTGALIEKSLLIGANYAKVEQSYKNLLSIYGINLGIIFQIIDDILGSFGDENTTGKPTDGDIKEGKKTCLLITAMNDLDDQQKQKLNTLIENPKMNDDDVAEVKRLFEEADAANTCKTIAWFYFKQAKNTLSKLKEKMAPSEAEVFEDLLNFVMQRKF